MSRQEGEAGHSAFHGVCHCRVGTWNVICGVVGPFHCLLYPSEPRRCVDGSDGRGWGREEPPPQAAEDVQAVMRPEEVDPTPRVGGWLPASPQPPVARNHPAGRPGAAGQAVSAPGGAASGLRPVHCCGGSGSGLTTYSFSVACRAMDFALSSWWF